MTVFPFAAQAAVLGPELPVAAEQTLAAAPFEQGAPDVASNGTTALAVWLDARGSTPALPRTFAAYATLIDKDGQPLAPRGIQLAREAYAVQVATNGSEFLVVYGDQSDGRLYATRTIDGTPSPERTFIDTGTVVDLASNGHTYCAILADYGAAQSRAAILDSDGWPLALVPLADAIDAVIVSDGKYIAVGSSAQCDGVHECTRSVTATRIDESGATSHSVIASNRPFFLRTAAAAGDNGALVAWVGESGDAGRVTEVVTIDKDGRKNGSTRTVHTTEEPPFIGSDLGPSVAFDGARYLVGFPLSSSDAPLRAFYLVARVDEDGVPLDTYPIALSSAMDSGFVAAEVAHKMLLVWSEWGDLHARTMNSFLSVDQTFEPDTILPVAPDVQSETALAVSNGVGFAAWVEGEDSNKIMATFFTPPEGTNAPLRDAPPVTLAGFGNVTYAAPSVAAAGDRFIALWRESFDEETRLYAQRWSASGAKIDAEPLLLDVTAGSPLDAMTDTAVASDGTDFFAVWRHDRELYGAVIPRSGTARTPFRVSRTEANYHARVSPSIAWTGSMYLVVWQHDPRNPYLLSPPAPPVIFVQLARVTADGTLLDTTSSPVIATMPGTAPTVAIASGTERALVVFPDDSCMHGVLLGTDGSIVSDLAPFDCIGATLGARDDVAVTWTGNAFVAAWSRGSVEAARIAQNGSLLERFSFAEAGWSPALTPGVAAYARIGSDGTGRIVARTFRGGANKRRSV